MQHPVLPEKRVDVTLSSDSEDEQPGMKTAAAGADSGDGAVKGLGSGKRQLAASPVKTQYVYSIYIYIYIYISS